MSQYDNLQTQGNQQLSVFLINTKAEYSEHTNIPFK